MGARAALISRIKSERNTEKKDLLLLVALHPRVFIYTLYFNLVISFISETCLCRGIIYAELLDVFLIDLRI